MQWWSDFLDWIQSDAGWKIISTAVIPFVAIVVAGIIGAAIARGAIRRLIAQRDHEMRASAVAALVAAGQGAATWHSQGPDAKEHAELLASQADVAVRLLPIAGADLAADWASHELRDMRTNSVSYSYQAEQTLDEYRDRLVEWLHKPSRAKKLGLSPSAAPAAASAAASIGRADRAISTPLSSQASRTAAIAARRESASAAHSGRPATGRASSPRSTPPPTKAR